MKGMKHFFLAAAAGLALSIAPAMAKVVPLDRVIAIVDNDVIMESELSTRLKGVRAQLQDRHTSLPSEKVLKKQVLERLILENLQLQLADRAGARIDDNALNEAIGNIARRNGMSVPEFRQALAQDGLAYKDVREQIRREMLINRVRQRQVMERIQITDREVENYRTSAEGQQQLAVEYRLGHILVALPEGASPQQIQAASKKADAIYEKLKTGSDFAQIAISQSQGQSALEGGDLGWRKADQLPALFANVAATLKTGDVSRPMRTPSGFHIVKLMDKRGDEKMLQEQVKVRHILIKPNEVRSDLEAQELARSLYDRLQAGESFEELAKAYSDDTGSALNGGDLGWSNPDVMVPEFRKKMESQPLHTISEPFRSSFGWHIMEVEGRRKQDISSQVQVARIRDLLRQRKYEEELEVWLRELRDQAYVEVKL